MINIFKTIGVIVFLCIAWPFYAAGCDYNGGEMMFLVINIGCIECGVSSQVVGLFKTKEEADKIADKCIEKYDWRHGGQNEFTVFPLPEVGVINSEYEL